MQASQVVASDSKATSPTSAELDEAISATALAKENHKLIGELKQSSDALKKVKDELADQVVQSAQAATARVRAEMNEQVESANAIAAQAQAHVVQLQQQLAARAPATVLSPQQTTSGWKIALAVLGVCSGRSRIVSGCDGIT